MSGHQGVATVETIVRTSGLISVGHKVAVMEVKMKRLLMAVLYLVVVTGIVLGVSQVIERPAAAEGSTCCLTSADCPGKQYCYAPSTGTPACCTGPNCVGGNTARIRGRIDAAARN